jgi:hypothetical protein
MSTRKSSPAESHMDAGSFVPRHIGPSDAEQRDMLQLLGFESLDAMIDATVPARFACAVHSRFTAAGASTRRWVISGASPSRTRCAGRIWGLATTPA